MAEQTPLTQQISAASPAVRNVTPGSEVILGMKDVAVSYEQPDGRRILVVEGIDLDVHAHEVVAIMGPSGAGKSTIVRLLAGLIAPVAGQVTYRGSLLAGINPHVSIVFQNFALFPWLTARENIETVLLDRIPDPEVRREKVNQKIKVVGLEGFEDVYPRDLSGGMRQRIGMARGLAVEPEILILDEPFSQVDLLTRENLRAELMEIWMDKEKNPVSMVFISNDIKEIALLASRVYFMDSGPGHIRDMVPIPLPYPRDPRTREFEKTLDMLHEHATRAIIPDEGPGAIPPDAVTGKSAGQTPLGAGKFEPLPRVYMGEINGLLEILWELKGRVNVFELNDLIAKDFTKTMRVVKSAELLDFVDTPRQQVELTPRGTEYVSAGVDDRPRLLKMALLQLEVFRHLMGMLERADDKSVSKDVVLEMLAIKLPYEHPERLFQTILNWGRTAKLLSHDTASNVLSLHQTMGGPRKTRVRKEKEPRQAAAPADEDPAAISPESPDSDS